ncbi:MAG: hypothetical protein WC356_04315 [Candidatus Micrarchaeia archaeon]|jgi:hypothetical protein
MVDEVIVKSCGTCRFFKKEGYRPDGYCVARPPFLGVTNWPVVLPNQWCGGWEARIFGGGKVEAIPKPAGPRVTFTPNPLEPSIQIPVTADDLDQICALNVEQRAKIKELEAENAQLKDELSAMKFNLRMENGELCTENRKLQVEVAGLKGDNEEMMYRIKELENG